MALFQFDGLASGLQTSQIIDSLLSTYRIPVQRMDAKRAAISARKSAIQTLNTKLASLANAVSDLTKASALNVKATSVTKNGSSTSALLVSAGSEAANGTFNVTIKQLATATRVDSGSRIGQSVDPGVALQDAGLSIAPSTTTGTTSGSFTINGVPISVDHAVDSLNDVIARINASGAGVTATLVDADGNASATGNYVELESGSTITLGSGADTSNFLDVVKVASAVAAPATVTGATVDTGALASTQIAINGVVVTTRATATGSSAAQNAASLAEDINNTSGIDVTATANADGTLTLTSQATGIGATIDITEAGTGTGLSAGTTTQNSDIYSSTSAIGGTQVNANLTDANLQTAISGLDAEGNGSFKINGVEISYSDTDSITNVLNRISASSAGVSASYDSVLDRVVLTSKTTGSKTIALEDVTGNFLAAVGLLGATQVTGKNAVYSIDTVAGGADQTSSTNVVSGVLPGVELTLREVSADPVQVTISQDVDAAVKTVQGFVDSYNATMAHLRSVTKIDPTGDESGVLSGDAGVRGLERTLRGLLIQPATGVAAPYQDISTVGLSFGAVGSEVGTTNDLKLDADKLKAALNDNPDAVAALLSGFSSTATLEGGGTGSVAAVAGTPTGVYQSGTYTVTTTTTGSISAVFTPDNGVAGPERFGSALTPGGTETTVIPGMTITATDPLVDGTNTIRVEVTQKGVLVGLKDYLNTLTSTGGMLESRESSLTSQDEDLVRRIEDAERRIDAKRVYYERQFAALEAMMAELQSQNASLQAQLLQLAGPPG